MPLIIANPGYKSIANIPGVIQELEYGKEAPQNHCPEQATIAEWQGASEDGDFEVKLTPPEPILESRAVY